MSKSKSITVYVCYSDVGSDYTPPKAVFTSENEAKDFISKQPYPSEFQYEVFELTLPPE